ncbi:hypothetical protein BJV74DRAFT_889826 [Russula compacta]|nr:hypothetical protein BJV74DRAFT_889826 [Russula compacta]
MLTRTPSEGSGDYKYTLGSEQDVSSPTEFFLCVNHPLQLHFIIKPKYCIVHDHLLRQGTKAVSSSASVQVLLYKSYLRLMHIMGEANLSLDCKNLHAFPPSCKLYGQLIKYLQEVILAMDHMLKDIMLKLMEEDQAECLKGMQDIDTGAYAREDEDIWEEFKREFNMTFADTAAKEKALKELTLLGQKNMEGIDEYIVTFEELLDKLSWDRTPELVVERFKDGLMKTLLNRILDHDIWPESLDEWQHAAR